MKKVILFTIIVWGLCSCERERFDVTKLYPQGFSSTELSFSVNGGDTIVTSQRNEWSLDDYFMYDEQYFSLPRCDEVFPVTAQGVGRNPGICSDSLFTVKYDFFQKNCFEIIQIESSWFTIIKTTPKQIDIAIEPNLTGKTRQIRLGLGDKQGSNITIFQSIE
jgi:hypothetical protein